MLSDFIAAQQFSETSEANVSQSDAERPVR